MKLAIFGASGNIGTRILNEALSRGHEIVAVVRDPNHFKIQNPKVKIVKADVQNPKEVAEAIKGVDAVITAIGPAKGENPHIVVSAAKSLIAGLKKAHVDRILVVGGAGVLEVAPGIRLVETPNFPQEYIPIAEAHGEALDIYKKSDLDWTYISPAIEIGPGNRTGHFRLGHEKVMMDDKGESKISMEDYAVALMNELEQPHNIHKRMAVAY